MSGGDNTYGAAGVDLDAADETVDRLKSHVARTSRPEVLDGIGGFGGLFALSTKGIEHPVLVSATDGVGTKLELARQLGRHDTVGIDLVAMVVDDIVVSGAEPLFFLDYIAVGKLLPEHVEQVVAGIAEGCVQAGCALVGGETAEHPGVMPPDQYDLAGFGVGIVDRTKMLGAHRVEVGDAVVAMASSGAHSNGYSLVRRIVDGLDLSADHGLREHSLGDALLTPTTIYTRACLELARRGAVHALCHVTGGGIEGNLGRVLPRGMGAVIDTTTFSPPEVFGALQRLGSVAPAEMWRTFNMGAGMLTVVPDARDTVSTLQAAGVTAWECGRIDSSGAVRLLNL